MSSELLDPISRPQDWDYITIGGVQSPGLAEVGEFKRKHEWDKKKGKGGYGESITFIQRPAATGSVKFKLWKLEHFVSWASFRELLKYDPTKKAVQAIEIFHPSLADININSVVTESIGNIIHEGQQLYSITIEFLEYFPPPPVSAVGTPTSASTNAGANPGDPPDPIGDDKQRQILDLTTQAKQPIDGG